MIAIAGAFAIFMFVVVLLYLDHRTRKQMRQTHK